MMCYRDMTFCSRAEECANHEVCPLWFSPEERAKAEKWWGNDDPLVAFSDFVDCHNYRSEPNNRETA